VDWSADEQRELDILLGEIEFEKAQGKEASELESGESDGSEEGSNEQL
jgi:hypothetical protein